MDSEQDKALLRLAEEKIQSILLDLVNEHGLDIDGVKVDTRNWANFRVEIWTRPLP